METDASGVGLGAVLAQVQNDGTTRPIAYASHTVQKHEANYGITKLEALVVVWAVKHFRIYLYGHRCDIYTDHEALKSILNTRHPSGKLARWGLALQELDLHIRYWPGKKNSNADALSRVGMEVPQEPSTDAVLLAAVIDEGRSSQEGDRPLKQRQRQDPELNIILKYLEGGDLPKDDKSARELVLAESQYTESYTGLRMTRH